MQVSNGKTIWPMFARQTATTSGDIERERGYLQLEEERPGRRRDRRREGKALFKQSIVGGASQSGGGGYPSRAQRRGEERTSGQRATDMTTAALF